MPIRVVLFVAFPFFLMSCNHGSRAGSGQDSMTAMLKSMTKHEVLGKEPSDFYLHGAMSTQARSPLFYPFEIHNGVGDGEITCELIDTRNSEELLRNIGRFAFDSAMFLAQIDSNWVKEISLRYLAIDYHGETLFTASDRRSLFAMARARGLHASALLSNTEYSDLFQ